MQLSPNFTLEELTASQIAARLGCKVEPDGNALENLRKLSLYVLEPIRAHVNAPIIPSSGYRPPWLNQLVGGSPTSDHMEGCAVDFTAKGISPRRLAIMIADILPRLPVKQLILEFDAWVHVSVSIAIPAKRQILTAQHRETGTVYLPGIV